MPTPIPTPRRRRLRLTLQALMLLVLVLALAMGYKANRARTQRLAVDEVKAAKGRISYDFEYSSDVARRSLTPVDDSLPLLGRLPHLREISFSGPGVTDAGLAHLATFTTVETLAILDNPKVTDAIQSGKIVPKRPALVKGSPTPSSTGPGPG